jgi:hypothetical protein
MKGQAARAAQRDKLPEQLTCIGEMTAKTWAISRQDRVFDFATL